MAKDKKRITIEDIEALPKEVLVPTDIAPLFGCASYSINCQAHIDITKLGFPASLMGSRVMIPKIGFVRWWKYERQVPERVPLSEMSRLIFNGKSQVDQ